MVFSSSAMKLNGERWGIYKIVNVNEMRGKDRGKDL
jgi:hypothetical protein